MTFKMTTDGKDQAFFAASKKRFRESLEPTNRRALDAVRMQVASAAPSVTGRVAASYEVAGVTKEGGRVESGMPYPGALKGYVTKGADASTKDIERETEAGLNKAMRQAERDAS